eukprot:s4234_g1.t1
MVWVTNGHGVWRETVFWQGQHWVWVRGQWLLPNIEENRIPKQPPPTPVPPTPVPAPVRPTPAQQELGAAPPAPSPAPKPAASPPKRCGVVPNPAAPKPMPAGPVPLAAGPVPKPAGSAMLGAVPKPAGPKAAQPEAKAEPKTWHRGHGAARERRVIRRAVGRLEDFMLDTQGWARRVDEQQRVQQQVAEEQQRQQQLANEEQHRQQLLATESMVKDMSTGMLSTLQNFIERNLWEELGKAGPR